MLVQVPRRDFSLVKATFSEHAASPMLAAAYQVRDLK